MSEDAGDIPGTFELRLGTETTAGILDEIFGGLLGLRLNLGYVSDLTEEMGKVLGDGVGVDGKDELKLNAERKGCSRRHSRQFFPF
jgi:hypothetical protein